jgi:hypothetical protein
MRRAIILVPSFGVVMQYQKIIKTYLFVDAIAVSGQVSI